MFNIERRDTSLAGQDSSIGDLVTPSVSLLIAELSDYNDYNGYNDYNDFKDYNDYNYYNVLVVISIQT